MPPAIAQPRLSMRHLAGQWNGVAHAALCCTALDLGGVVQLCESAGMLGSCRQAAAAVCAGQAAVEASCTCLGLPVRSVNEWIIYIYI